MVVFCLPYSLALSSHSFTCVQFMRGEEGRYDAPHRFLLYIQTARAVSSMRFVRLRRLQGKEKEKKKKNRNEKREKERERGTRWMK